MEAWPVKELLVAAALPAVILALRLRTMTASYRKGCLQIVVKTTPHQDCCATKLSSMSDKDSSNPTGCKAAE